MRVTGGREVLTELEEIVDPKHAALIIVDMQRDFCSPDGFSSTVSRSPLSPRPTERC